MKAESTAWILVRGLAREAAHWGPFLEQFKKRFPNDDVIALDLPGFGEFAGQASPRSVTEMFNFIRGQAIARAKSQSPFKVVAMSLGGMVAMEWLKKKPEDLGAVVLINTSAKNLSPAYRRLRWQIWPGFVKAISTQSLKDREKLLIDLLINSPEAREKALPLWVKIANEQRGSYLNFANQLFAAARFKGLEQKADVPVLLLSGLGDRFVDPSCSSVLHDQFGWQLERHAWAGHDLPWDDPEWCLSKIHSWNSSLNASH